MALQPSLIKRREIEAAPRLDRCQAGARAGKSAEPLVQDCSAAQRSVSALQHHSDTPPASGTSHSFGKTLLSHSSGAVMTKTGQISQHIMFSA